MKTIANISFVLILLAFMSTGFYSCKKEVPPTLNITVTDTNSATISGAEVRIYHGAPAPTGGASGLYNDDKYDQKKTTSSGGVATFDIPNSAVLDVLVIAPVVIEDPPNPPIQDTLTGKRVVKVELKWQRSKENEVNETVTVR